MSSATDAFHQQRKDMAEDVDTRREQSVESAAAKTKEKTTETDDGGKTPSDKTHEEENSHKAKEAARVARIAKKIGATEEKTRVFLREKERMESCGIPNTTTFEEMRERILPDTIHEIEGRPVRITPAAITLEATMVEPGVFPVSGTGFRSIAGLWWGVKQDEMDMGEAVEAAVKVAEGVAKERMEALSQPVQPPRGGVPDVVAGQTPGTEGEEAQRWVGHLASFSGPQTVSNRILTGPKERRQDIAEAYIPVYERAVRIAPLPDDHPNADLVNGGIEKAKTCLEILNGVRSGGLFSGEENLTPAIEAASQNVRIAYGGTPRLDIITEGVLRKDLRDELGVSALTEEEHLELLARRIWVCGHSR